MQPIPDFGPTPCAADISFLSFPLMLADLSAQFGLVPAHMHIVPLLQTRLFIATPAEVPLSCSSSGRRACIPEAKWRYCPILCPFVPLAFNSHNRCI
jgi:hypothetical protein